MNLLYKYRKKPLTLTELAHARKLPDELTLGDVSELFTDDSSDRARWLALLEDAVVTSNRRESGMNWDLTDAGLKAIPDHFSVRGDFKMYKTTAPLLRDWLKSEDAWPIKDCLLVHWWSEAAPQAEAVADGDAVDSLIPAQNDLQKRTKVLQDWLVTQKEYKPGEVFVLPKGMNHKSIQITLNNESTDKMLFDLALDSFKRHFWQQQKIAELKRGR